MEITTPNLDQPNAAPNQGVKVNNGYGLNGTHVQFAQIIHDTTPQAKKPGFFSGVLRALGGFAPLAYLAAPFTGGMSLIAGAAMQGAGAIGAKAQANHQMNEQQRLAQSGPPVVAFPGSAPAAVSDPTLNMISGARDGAVTAAIHR